MDPMTIIGGIMTAAGVGLGFGVGSRLMPIGIKAQRDLRRWKETGEAESHRRIAEDESRRVMLARPVGRKRDSSIAGIYEDVLRHTDGSYTRVYDAELQATMLAPDAVVESRYDELARMLAVEKPPGTVVQFRFTSGPDPGRAIAAHLRTRGDGALTHPEASRLHAGEYRFLHDRRPVARLPSRQALGLGARARPSGERCDEQGLERLHPGSQP